MTTRDTSSSVSSDPPAPPDPLRTLIAEWRSSADWMMGSTKPDDWQRGGSGYLRRCADELEAAIEAVRAQQENYETDQQARRAQEASSEGVGRDDAEAAGRTGRAAKAIRPTATQSAETEIAASLEPPPFERCPACRYPKKSVLHVEDGVCSFCGTRWETASLDPPRAPLDPATTTINVADRAMLYSCRQELKSAQSENEKLRAEVERGRARVNQLEDSMNPMDIPAASED